MASSEKKAIRVELVSKRYNKYVLKNARFSVRPGTIHGFIGPNGSGKTTTLNILVLLVLPTLGEAYIEDKSVNNDPGFNQNLGFIAAEPQFSGRTVEEYVVSCGYLRDVPEEEALRKLIKSPLAKFRHQDC